MIFSIVILSVAQFGISSVEWNKRSVNRAVLEEEIVSINRSLSEAFSHALSVDEGVGKTVYTNNDGKLVLNMNGAPTPFTFTKTGTNITLARGVGVATNITGNKVNVTKFYLEKILDTVSNTTIGVRVSVTIVSAGNTTFTRNFVTSYLLTN
jgi:hypothetical protein